MSNDPWPRNRCSDRIDLKRSVSAFEAVLRDAKDERPVQEFLAKHPSMLVGLLPPGGDAWCFDRPRLGSEYIPDFLLTTRNSNGFEWILIEIESPTKVPLNTKGLPSGKLTEALGQVRDWRSWIRPNIAYAQSQLGFNGLTAEVKAYVIMGRRASLDSRHATRYRELSDEKTSVMTYDRLLDLLSTTNRTGRNNG